MAADVKNNAFLLGEATLMMAPYGSASVFELTPEKHSLGMVRNITLSQESDTIELRKGIQQNLIDSKRSNVKTSLSCEVFEFSAQNVFYSMSMNRAAVDVKRGKLKAEAKGAASTIIVNSDPLPGQSGSGIATIADVPVGTTVLIQVSGTGNDYVLPVRTTAAATITSSDLTLTVDIPKDMTFPAGSRVWVVNEVPVASTADQEFFSVKAVGTLANYERPVTLVLPKVKVKRGFQITFDEGNYTSMPFEFDPYFLAQSEIEGRLAEIGTTQQGLVYL